ncbi:MAG: hypothetical protein JAY68_06400 [Candidatus Thiodiazotropha taylori]|nr:hypothetical protein [Candidatus Thiodiazotropha taylori]
MGNQGDKCIKPSTNLSRDGKQIWIFIPAQLGCLSGRMTILSPSSQTVNPDCNKEADVTLINALVRTHRWNRWLAKGKSGSVKKIATEEVVICPSYISHILC